MVSVASIAADLDDEQSELDDIVAAIEPAAWQTPTASPGWNVADQIGHLIFFDEAAVLAITDPDGFAAHRDELFSDMETWEAKAAASFKQVTVAILLDRWRSARAELQAAAAGLNEDDRIGWYGPDMGAKSFLTARLMECWAHGQDIVDALGVTRENADRIGHIARLGYLTRNWSYINRGLPEPTTEVGVTLTAPSGENWQMGPAHAAESVTGTAVDFALVTTQRRHVDDTELVVIGDSAREWLLIAQAFAGGPTDGPAPQNKAKDKNAVG